MERLRKEADGGDTSLSKNKKSPWLGVEKVARQHANRHLDPEYVVAPHGHVL